MRTLNLLVGMFQVVAMVALGLTALATTTPALVVMFAVGGMIAGASGGRLLAIGLFGDRRDQWDA